MSTPPSRSETSDIRAVMQRAGRPASARSRRRAIRAMRLIRLLPYLNPFKVMLVRRLRLRRDLHAARAGRAVPDGRGDRSLHHRRSSAAGLARIALLMLVVVPAQQPVPGHGRLDDGGHLAARAESRCAAISSRTCRRLPLSFFDRNPAGELMSRLTNDIDAINQAVSQNVTSLLASVLSLVGILIAMFVLDRWLALASLLVVPIMFWFTQFVARYTRRGFRDLQKHLGELNGVMEEAISGQKVVKAFRRNESVIGRVPRAQPGGLQGGRLRQQLRAAADAADQRAGQLLRDRAGRAGRLAGAARAGHRRHHRHVHHLRAELHPAAAPAGQHVQHDPGGAGRSRARLRDHRYAVGEWTTRPDALRRIAQTLHGDVRFEHVHFGYRPSTPIIKDMTLEAKRRADDRPGRPDGRGQDDDHQPADALLRDRRRADHHRRHGHPRHPARPICAAQLGLVLQDTFLFADTVHGEHPLRAAGRDRRGSASQAAEVGRRRSLHPAVAAGLPDAALGAGQQPEPGPAAAAVDRARHPGRSRHPDSGRGDEQRRHAHRGAHPEVAAAADAGPHQLRDRAPPEHHPRCRPSAGHRSTARSSSGARTRSCSTGAASIITCTSASSRARRFDVTLKHCRIKARAPASLS